MKLRKKLLWAIPALFLLIQVVRIDKTNPPLAPGEDFRAVMRPPADVARLVEVTCYDCHSHETQYPWYSNVAPFSWALANHVREGREHLNFSTFGALALDDRAEKLHECAEEIEGGEMPPGGYTAFHAEARLTDDDRQRLIQWFNQSNPGGLIGEEEAGDDRERVGEE